METKRLTASEREAIMRIALAADILQTEEGNVRDRLPLVKNGKRDMRMLSAVATRLWDGLKETVPENQRESFNRSLKTASILIGVKKPNGAVARDNREYGLWISFDQLNALLDGCHEKCLMCSLDGQERRACALRKRLNEIPHDGPDDAGGECPYYGIV